MSIHQSIHDIRRVTVKRDRLDTGVGIYDKITLTVYTDNGVIEVDLYPKKLDLTLENIK